jgi:hypothetical protein
VIKRQHYVQNGVLDDDCFIFLCFSSGAASGQAEDAKEEKLSQVCARRKQKKLFWGVSVQLTKWCA